MTDDSCHSVTSSYNSRTKFAHYTNSVPESYRQRTYVIRTRITTILLYRRVSRFEYDCHALDCLFSFLPSMTILAASTSTIVLLTSGCKIKLSGLISLWIIPFSCSFCREPVRGQINFSAHASDSLPPNCFSQEVRNSPFI